MERNKVKTSERSFGAVLLWAKYIENELKTNFSLEKLEEGIEDQIKKKYGRRTTSFKFYLREEIKKILEGIEFFLNGEISQSLTIIYCDGNNETAHPNQEKQKN